MGGLAVQAVADGGSVSLVGLVKRWYLERAGWLWYGSGGAVLKQQEQSGGGSAGRQRGDAKHTTDAPGSQSQSPSKLHPRSALRKLP